VGYWSLWVKVGLFDFWDHFGNTMDMTLGRPKKQFLMPVFSESRGRWMLDIPAAMAGKRKKLFYLTQQKAMAEAARIMNEIAIGSPITPPKTSKRFKISNLIDAYLAERKNETSSDNYTLYGKDSTGQAMQTDETLNSPWQPIGNLQGTLYGKGLDGTLYGKDSQENAFEFKEKVSPLYTQQLIPTSIDVDQTSNQLWMTTATPGEAGNIFTRLQTPDYTSIMNTVTPLDKTRDTIVQNVESEFKKQTDTMILHKQF
jgi:hypothetical protein